MRAFLAEVDDGCCMCDRTVLQVLHFMDQFVSMRKMMAKSLKVSTLILIAICFY
jgi:hypothetical protein